MNSQQRSSDAVHCMIHMPYYSPVEHSSSYLWISVKNETSCFELSTSSYLSLCTW